MPSETEITRKMVAAEMERRQRVGLWSGSVIPHYEYQTRPLDWIVEKLLVPRPTLEWSLNPGYETHQWDADPDPIAKILGALADGKDCGCESATGTGKTFLAACIVLWWLACFEDSICSTIAPKEDQLLKHVWKEIGDLFPRFQEHFPLAEMLTGVIRMKPQDTGREKWAASAFVCGVGASEEVATKAQGLHAEHLLIITEETPGIHMAIMEALHQTRTDDHNLHLALGNPDHQQDALHRFCFDEKGKPMPGVVHVRISAFDHPNIVSQQRIVPGAIGVQRLKDRIERLGQGSRLFESRIRGISPKEATDALIKWDWCVAAAERWADPEFRDGPLALGVDVADSPSGDKAAISRWQGACCTEVTAYTVEDASIFGIQVFNEATDKDNPVDPRYIGIDPVGVGASTVNKLRELGLRLRRLFGSARAVPGIDVDLLWSETDVNMEGRIQPTGPTVVETERYDNLRSQVWWRAREDLRLGRIALPPDEELWQDLCTPSYETKGGKIQVESKETVITRLRRSPNKGDACVYGNFVRRRTPSTRQVRPKLPVDRVPNRDYGLERRLAIHEKRVKAEERRIKRMYERKGRGR